MQRTDSLKEILMLGKIEARRRRDDREWDCWMASLTRWTWVWVSSRSWWWTGRPVLLQSTGSQKVRHKWASGLNWPENAKLSLYPLSPHAIFFFKYYFHCFPNLRQPCSLTSPAPWQLHVFNILNSLNSILDTTSYFQFLSNQIYCFLSMQIWQFVNTSSWFSHFIFPSKL